MKEKEGTNETRLEVDLDALEANLNYYRSQLKEGTRIMVMVKAASYGFGAVGVPRFLEEQGVDYLGVVFADEGELLRDEGIRTPIMVMNPGPRSFDKILDRGLEPLLHSRHNLEEFLEVCERRGEKSPIPFHLKLESGMNRLGVPDDELDGLIERVGEHPELELRSVMSHLASSSSSTFDPFTREQIARFEADCERIAEGIGRRGLIRHILNSAGVSRFPEAHFEMVRLGIGLYGVGATVEDRKNVRNIASLKTRISQVKDVGLGETVGYDRAFKADRSSRIAIIPIGYADGFPRVLGQGVGIARVNGKIVRVVGKVCMDMTFLDVTDVDCEEGDEAVLMDDEYPLPEFARSMDRIPYEAITSISGRISRVYVKSQD